MQWNDAGQVARTTRLAWWYADPDDASASTQHIEKRDVNKASISLVWHLFCSASPISSSGRETMPEAVLTISSKNYSSWSLRGWLLCRMVGLDFAEEIVPVDDPASRAELLLLSPSILVPCLIHNGIRVWDTLAIAEYLNEVKPRAGLLPKDRAARARCRAICGEMHSGFTNLRSALPMNLKARRLGFKIWSGAQA